MPILSGKTALVTGSSRGIGRTIALKLASEGATLLLHYRENESAAQSVAREIHGYSRIVQADLRSPQEVERMFEALASTRLDILVNNAGIWGPSPLGSTSAQQVDDMIDLNVKGLFLVTQAALPLFRDGGSIINLSSVAGRIGIAGGRSLYGATKAAVDSFTKSWAMELGPRHIRVNAVAPGYVETDMTAKHFSNPEVRRKAVERHPFGRLGNTEDVADAVLFLCSHAARWITGQSINVSGGFVI
jgi:NAD(P)-dependent dehydrogenase (short-subunit alcohol dehydrogenase family)